jgi:pyruvate formate lyase activating enzyme
MIVRMPLAHGYNANDTTVWRTGRLLGSIGALSVEVLGLHHRGAVKWHALGREEPAKDSPPPTPAEVVDAKSILAGFGLLVR